MVISLCINDLSVLICPHCSRFGSINSNCALRYYGRSTSTECGRTRAVKRAAEHAAEHAAKQNKSIPNSVFHYSRSGSGWLYRAGTVRARFKQRSKQAKTVIQTATEMIAFGNGDKLRKRYLNEAYKQTKRTRAYLCT